MRGVDKTGGINQKPSAPEDLTNILSGLQEYVREKVVSVVEGPVQRLVCEENDVERSIFEGTEEEKLEVRKSAEELSGLKDKKRETKKQEIITSILDGELLKREDIVSRLKELPNIKPALVAKAEMEALPHIIGVKRLQQVLSILNKKGVNNSVLGWAKKNHLLTDEEVVKLEAKNDEKKKRELFWTLVRRNCLKIHLNKVVKEDVMDKGGKRWIGEINANPALFNNEEMRGTLIPWMDSKGLIIKRENPEEAKKAMLNEEAQIRTLFRSKKVAGIVEYINTKMYKMRGAGVLENEERDKKKAAARYRMNTKDDSPEAYRGRNINVLTTPEIISDKGLLEILGPQRAACMLKKESKMILTEVIIKANGEIAEWAWGLLKKNHSEELGNEELTDITQHAQSEVICTEAWEMLTKDIQPEDGILRSIDWANADRLEKMAKDEDMGWIDVTVYNAKRNDGKISKKTLKDRMKEERLNYLVETDVITASEKRQIELADQPLQTFFDILERKDMIRDLINIVRTTANEEVQQGAMERLDAMGVVSADMWDMYSREFKEQMTNAHLSEYIMQAPEAADEGWEILESRLDMTNEDDVEICVQLAMFAPENYPQVYEAAAANLQKIIQDLSMERLEALGKKTLADKPRANFGHVFRMRKEEAVQDRQRKALEEERQQKKIATDIEKIEKQLGVENRDMEHEQETAERHKKVYAGKVAANRVEEIKQVIIRLETERDELKAQQNEHQPEFQDWKRAVETEQKANKDFFGDIGDVSNLSERDRMALIKKVLMEDKRSMNEKREACKIWMEAAKNLQEAQKVWEKRRAELDEALAKATAPKHRRSTRR